MDNSNVKHWDNDHFLHPWEGMATLGKNDRTFIEGASGIHVMNEKGERLIDGPGGMWCTQIGYGREEMAEAMAEQARNLAYFSPFNNSNSTTARFAREIAKRAPGDLNNVFFTTGGSTAVDTAIRFVHFRNNLLGRPEKKKIISRQKAYHGSTFLAASVSGKERDRHWLDKADDLAHFLPDVNPLYRAPGQSEESFLKEKVSDLENAIVALGPENVAAFIAEPVLASGGVIVPPKGYHESCLNICKKYDVLYISDEVVTAFGRLGHWFASETVFGIQPDIVTCAKGMTSGYAPMGAAIISDRLIADVAGKDATFSNGYTYSGHPVSAAAGLKSMEIIEREKLLEHVRRVTPIFQDQLQQLGQIDIVTDVRGMGLMGCVQCSVDGDPQSDLGCDYEIGSQIDIECQKRGLLVRPVINMCVLSPPLIISESEIEQMFDVLRKGLEATSTWLSGIRGQ
ncbi:Adenosylmethionine-8-amino-7-oxononanoate aminotransferase [Ruegeria faecimaris]|uniref:Adenosylmethionine-8-amino-7-oxononanoate aminotransferase n=2 Tax=Ruegeria faecimaris TaxID=686389 RepID=A0A521FI95_9RHOB|nr:Adenosylmethionine-8-amino-7-oxononanoate aminotransferase [Ruegeria faecimaris]